MSAVHTGKIILMIFYILKDDFLHLETPSGKFLYRNQTNILILS